MCFIPSPSLHPEEFWDKENAAQGGTFPWQSPWYHTHDLNYHLSSMGNFLPLFLSIGGSNGKESACNAGDLGSIPGSRRSTRKGNGNPHQYFCQENSMEREVWWARVHRVTRVGHDWATNTHCKIIHIYIFSSVQSSRSVVSNSLQPHEPQYTRPPCPSPTAGVYPNLCPSSQWCHPTISSSVIPFSSCP